jgi:formylglycine-generating enzyme required for sulfatase activity
MIRRAILFCVALLGAGPCFAAIPFRDCPECPEMVVIPPGSFTLGSPSFEGRVYANEGPQRRVTISRAFAVGIYDITFDQWYLCIADGGCNGYWPEDQGWGRGNRPVINVSWEDAQRYVRWLNDKLRRLQPVAADSADPGPYRLLSEAEWEYAARAGTTTAYYWGDVHGSGYANCDGCGSQWDNKQTAPVGSFAPNPFGLYDMAGNVLQWVEDCYHENYASAPADGAPWTTGKCYARVQRGGSWYNSTYYLRAANRYSNAPAFHGLNVGFRVARTLE